jgi:hypothetical protein
VVVGDELSRLWRKHQHAEFPPSLRGAERAGVDLVELDADVAGCVEAWRDGGFTLDEDRLKILTKGAENLDAVLPLLSSRAESLYFDRLRRLAAVILDS